MSLEQRSDFLRVGGSGLRYVTPAFILQAAPLTAGADLCLRIGFTASRKVGNAVARNRAKRRLRTLVDRLMADADPALDYVFVGRAETLRRPFAAMEKDLRDALPRIARAARPKAAAP